MRKDCLLFFTVIVLLFACQSIPKADKGIIAPQQPAVRSTTSPKYLVDTTSSFIAWTGTKPVGQHTGLFKLAHGLITVENNQVNSGNFVIDIASLTDTDLKGNAKKKLEAHLKSVDFFDVERFPSALFELTHIKLYDATVVNSSLNNPTHIISGNLTLKGVTKNVTFPASISLSSSTVEAKANFNIDRTDWGLNYGNEKSLQDRFIHPTVNIELHVKANKQL